MLLTSLFSSLLSSAHLKKPLAAAVLDSIPATLPNPLCCCSLSCLCFPKYLLPSLRSRVFCFVCLFGGCLGIFFSNLPDFFFLFSYFRNSYQSYNLILLIMINDSFTHENKISLRENPASSIYVRYYCQL